MKFGFFDDPAKEYVITRPDTPRAWSFYHTQTSRRGGISPGLQAGNRSHATMALPLTMKGSATDRSNADYARISSTIERLMKRSQLCRRIIAAASSKAATSTRTP